MKSIRKHTEYSHLPTTDTLEMSFRAQKINNEQLVFSEMEFICELVCVETILSSFSSMTWYNSSHICNKQGRKNNLNSVTDERVWDVEERETKKGNTSSKAFFFLINPVNPESFQAQCHNLLMYQ